MHNFWKLDIPIAYGTVQLNALDALSQMPQELKTQLQSDRSIRWRFVALWVDSMDYAYGIDDLGKGSRLPANPNRSFAIQLTSSAHRELAATVRLLTESQGPNAKSFETARMATEMFLKSYLTMHGSLDELESLPASTASIPGPRSSCISTWPLRTPSKRLPLLSKPTARRPFATSSPVIRP
jgi:hypothetical protein